MKHIGVATFTRADYGALLPVVRALDAEPSVDLRLYVGGTHLLAPFGDTVRDIEGDGIPITSRIAMPLADDSAGSVARFVASGLSGLAGVLESDPPDVLVLLGDRVELLAAATAATVFGVPIAHISGGEVTEGAIDNQVRDAVTKLSHLHFVAMPAAAERLAHIGEEPWRVFVTGDPGLDTILGAAPVDRGDLARVLGMELAAPVIVVTYHPTTLGGSASGEILALLEALAGVSGTLVVTHPNADVGHGHIERALRTFVAGRPAARLFASLGHEVFHGLLAHADLMVGNSSSGIWEAPSFGLPVVNVGDRQKGRIRGANVIDVPADAGAIREGIAKGLAPAFRASLRSTGNPYGDGKAAERILEVLARDWSRDRLLRKRPVGAPDDTGGSG